MKILSVDTTGCRQAACYCHDRTIPERINDFCSHCGCQFTLEHPAMLTQINAQPFPWTPEILAIWTRLLPPLQEGQWVSQANFFTPRPYVDKWNRGSDKWGFVYTLQPGNHVCFINRRGEIV